MAREDNSDPYQQQSLSTVAKLQRHQEYLQVCDKQWGSNPNLEVRLRHCILNH